MKLFCFYYYFFYFYSIYGENKRPFIYFEVIDLGGEPIKNTDYTWMGRVSEFRYGKFLSEVVRQQFGQKLRYLNNFGTGNN
jgi:alpha-amylase